MKIVDNKTFEKRISDYLFSEAMHSLMGLFVFIVLIIGLFSINMETQQTLLVNIFFYSLIALVGAVAVYVCIFEVYKINIYKKILKNETYSVEDCISRDVTMRMNRARKEIELVAKYESDSGELSEKEFTVLSNKKLLTVQDCEGKDCKYVKFTDNFGFLYVE